MGLTLSELTPELLEELSLGRSVAGLAITDVNGASEAYEKGLRPGDVITEAGQRPVETAEDLQDRIEAARDAGRKSILLLISRAGDPRFVALSLQ